MAVMMEGTQERAKHGAKHSKVVGQANSVIAYNVTSLLCDNPWAFGVIANNVMITQRTVTFPNTRLLQDYPKPDISQATHEYLQSLKPTPFLNIFSLGVEEVCIGAFVDADVKASNLRPSAGCHATSKATLVGQVTHLSHSKSSVCFFFSMGDEATKFVFCIYCFAFTACSLNSLPHAINSQLKNKEKRKGAKGQS